MEAKDTASGPTIISGLIPAQKTASTSLSGLDDIHLIKVCAHDPTNSAAWQEFLSRFIGRIRAFVSSALESRRLRQGTNGHAQVIGKQDLDDLVQEVFLRLVANGCCLLKRFEGNSEDAVYRYFFVIASSVVIDRYKYFYRQRRLHHLSEVKVADPEILRRIGLNRDDLKTERAILLQEITQMVEGFLREEVPEAESRDRYLLIFKLHLFQGLSLSEIARYCGINLSKKGVDKIIARITERLKERLERQGGTHE